MSQLHMIADGIKHDGKSIRETAAKKKKAKRGMCHMLQAGSGSGCAGMRCYCKCYAQTLCNCNYRYLSDY
jgi:hypothetical protein